MQSRLEEGENRILNKTLGCGYKATQKDTGTDVKITVVRNEANS